MMCSQTKEALFYKFKKDKYYTKSLTEMKRGGFEPLVRKNRTTDNSPLSRKTNVWIGIFSIPFFYEMRILYFS